MKKWIVPMVLIASLLLSAFSPVAAAGDLGGEAGGFGGCSITVLEHPPYSPDLAPCDFFLFHKCKLVLWGQHLGDVMTKVKQHRC